MRNFDDHFAAILSGLDSSEECFADFVRAYTKFKENLEDELLPDRVKQRDIEHRGGAQSKQFMIQLAPTIQQYMKGFRRGKFFEILDVGPGAGFGSDLLGSMYRRTTLGYHATVHTTDILPDYIRFARVFCPDVNPQVANIFEINRTFEIVIASHVIEHVREWQPFVRRLRAMSYGIVIICSPYNEDPATLTSGHVNIFDDTALAALDADKIEYVESPAWGQFRDPPYKMFIATLSGGAKFGVQSHAA